MAWGNVLLGRPRSRIELVNDINDRLINWWLVVRDKPDELAYLSANTPVARSVYHWACANLDNTYIGNAHRALAFTIALEQGIMNSDGDERRSWGSTYNPAVGKLRSRLYEKIELLTQRIQDVQIECDDAINVIRKAVDVKDAIIYCDPPYRTSGTGTYRYGDVDIDALTDILKECKGRVAISGYEGEWEHLGWVSEEFVAKRMVMQGMNMRNTPRKEKLWLNYQPDRYQTSFNERLL